MLNFSDLRLDFPVLNREVNGYPLAYLDSANTSQKPLSVISRISDFYQHHNANVARAMHVLGAEATAAYENGRAAVARFINAKGAEEIVFTKNASESLNLLARTLGASLKPGDEVVISEMEHHSNIVPWQLVCQERGAKLRWFSLTDDGRLDLAKAAAEKLINDRTKIVSVTWVSNVLGTINPVAEIAQMAHRVGAVMVCDASQAVPHMPTDVQALGVDFLAFTAHKMLAPTGLGLLWGKYELLEQLPPFLGGGEMIKVVKMSGSTFADPPYRFEAGTQPIAQVVGLTAAIEYLENIGMTQVWAHEQELTQYLLQQLTAMSQIQILGPKVLEQRGGAIAFTVQVDGMEIHPHDVMTFLDARGVAVRGGHHCARPLHERYQVTSSVRASTYLYNTAAEIDQLIAALQYTIDFFGGKK